jgi:hypothetical protein
MARKTTTRKPTTPKLVNDGKPKGKGKGGTVTQHGVTTTGYQRGCRCDECVAAYSAARRAYREAKAAAAKPAKVTAKPKPATKRKPAAKRTTKPAAKPTTRRRAKAA